MGYSFGEELPAQIMKLRWQNKARWIRRIGLAAAALLACAGQLVPPTGGRAGLWSLAALGAALALRGAGVSTKKLYAGAVAVGLAVAMASP
jgi:hypothetical protein